MRPGESHPTECVRDNAKGEERMGNLNLGQIDVSPILNQEIHNVRSVGLKSQLQGLHSL
jgi:hypothetical protein